MKISLKNKINNATQKGLNQRNLQNYSFESTCKNCDLISNNTGNDIKINKSNISFGAKPLNYRVSEAIANSIPYDLIIIGNNPRFKSEAREFYKSHPIESTSFIYTDKIEQPIAIWKDSQNEAWVANLTSQPINVSSREDNTKILPYEKKSFTFSFDTTFTQNNSPLFLVSLYKKPIDNIELLEKIGEKISSAINNAEDSDLIVAGEEKALKLSDDRLRPFLNAITPRSTKVIEIPELNDPIAIFKQESNSFHLMNLGSKRLIIGDKDFSLLNRAVIKPTQRITFSFATKGNIFSIGDLKFKLTNKDSQTINLPSVIENYRTNEIPDDDEFAKIGGLSDTIEELRDIIAFSLSNNNLAGHFVIKNPPKGIILTSPPGCGKTTIARAIAKQEGYYFTHIGGPELEDKFHGEYERKLREVFEKARKNQPAIIFIDEIDSIASKRTSSDTGKHDNKILNQLLILMDGFHSREKILVIGATNRKDILDEALLRPGRLDFHFEIPKPDLKGCEEIFNIYTKGKPIAKEFNKPEFIQKLFKNKFSGADIEFVCNNATMIFLKRNGLLKARQLPANINELKISPQDFEKALERLIKQQKENKESKPIGYIHNEY